MEKGAILYHSSFEFKNGDIGEKLLIVLNDPDPAKEPYLLSRVTSQEKDKPKKFGCNEDLSLFFLPAGHDFFKKDTWVQLYDVYPIEADSLLKDRFGGELEQLGRLEEMTIRQLMNCIKRVKDISVKHKRMILKS